jgi:Uma2 family endonuclease
MTMDLHADPVATPPRGDFWSDEPQMETYAHLTQMLLLLACLERHWRHRSDFFCAGNLTIYFSRRQIRSEDFRGPDFFVVLGTTREPRRSWVVWEEDGKYPNVIVELVSTSTEAIDRGTKKRIYQDVFRTPDYILFDPESGDLEGWRLVEGVYEPMAPDARGLLWSAQLELFLGVRDGKLRFFERDGALVPTPDEEADALERKLRELGVDPSGVK